MVGAGAPNLRPITPLPQRSALTELHKDMLSSCPYALLQTSGRAVGLPDGQMGNSEVGHMNIGSGTRWWRGRIPCRASISPSPMAALAVRPAPAGSSLPRHAPRAAPCTADGTVVAGRRTLSAPGSHRRVGQDPIRCLRTAGDGTWLSRWARRAAQKRAEVDLKKFLADIAGLPGVAARHIIRAFCYAMDRDKRWDPGAEEEPMPPSGSMPVGMLAMAMVSRSTQGVTYDDRTSCHRDEFLVLPVTLGGYAGMADGDVERSSPISVPIVRARFPTWPCSILDFNGFFARPRVVQPSPPPPARPNDLDWLSSPQ